MSLGYRLSANFNKAGVLKKSSPASQFLTLTLSAIICVLGSFVGNSAMAADRVQEGQKAPDFTLPDQNGKPTKLSDFQGKRILVFFYDVDQEPFTSKEKKSRFQDIKKFKLENTDILCIGPDPVASHKAMNTGFKLNFHLLTDKNDAVRKAYGFPTAVAGQHNHYALVVDQDRSIKKLVDGTKTADKEESMAKALKYLGDFSINAY
jgi:peroxiredoxin